MNNDKVIIELVNGCEGKSLYIDDYRVAGSKPWGGGTVEISWAARKEDILQAVGCGYWIKEDLGYGAYRYKCSKCGAHFGADVIDEFNHNKYCADCGAKMKLK